MSKENNELEVVSIRLVKNYNLLSNKPIKSPEDAINILGNCMSEFDKEVICVINLRTDGVPINCNFVSMGAVNYCLASPRELLKSAILSNAASIMMLHNHPSGNLTPSKADTQITDKMISVCNMVGIPLTDHVIVGGNNENYFSFMAAGLIDYNKEPKYRSNFNDIAADEFTAVKNYMPKAKSARR